MDTRNGRTLKERATDPRMVLPDGRWTALSAERSRTDQSGIRNVREKRIHLREAQQRHAENPETSSDRY